MFMENFLKTTNTMIERTLALYDFNKTEELMSQLGWKWATGVDTMGDGIPTQHAMWRMARNLLIEAYKRETTVSSGGFEARYENGELSLRFVPIESYTDNMDLDEGETKDDEVEVSGVPYKVPKSSVKARKKK